MLFSRKGFLGQIPFSNKGPRVHVARLGTQQDDIAWFEANRLNLVQQYAGQWLIVKDLAVRGAYPDFKTAYNSAVGAYGTQKFLIKQAVEKETPIRIAGIR
jgi:hypothetical protein